MILSTCSATPMERSKLILKLSRGRKNKNWTLLSFAIRKIRRRKKIPILGFKLRGRKNKNLSIKIYLKCLLLIEITRWVEFLMLRIKSCPISRIRFKRSNRWSKIHFLRFLNKSKGTSRRRIVDFAIVGSLVMFVGVIILKELDINVSNVLILIFAKIVSRSKFMIICLLR